MKIRTSETDPLRIAELPVGGGVVGITLCPGKTGESVFGADWARDLATDIAAIRDVGRERRGHADRGARVRAARGAGVARGGACGGPRVASLAGQGRAARRPPISRRAGCTRGRGCASGCVAGERVLVHCRGGLGRAGSVAARLLIEFGATPVRRSRRCGRRGRGRSRRASRSGGCTRSGRSMPRAMRGRRGSSRACWAVRSGMRSATGSSSIRWLPSGASTGRTGIRLANAGGVLEVSDDTQMSLFTLEGQLRAARDGVPLNEAIRQAYLDWYRTQSGRWNARDRSQARGLVRHAVLWQRQAPGNTCLSALGAGGLGSLDAPINDSKGCGGVMRTAPLGFLGDAVDDATLYVLGAAAAALTHGHPDGYAPSGVMALAVRRLIDGASWDEVIESGLRAVQVHPAASGTRQLLGEVGAALKSDEGAARASASFGQGWVGDEALAVGLHAAATAGEFQ